MPINLKARQLLRKRLKRGLVGLALELTNQAKVRATKLIDTGELRNSITHAETPRGVVWGVPRNAKNVALEYGFKPHFVPSSIIGGWMKRRGVGIMKARSQSINRNGKRSKRTRQFLGAGIFVGGKNSRLEQGAGQPGAKFGGKFLRWNTKGGRSKLLGAGKVGFSVVRWTVKNRLRAVGKAAFLAGYKNAR